MVFKSNQVSSKGRDELIFYNYKIDKEIKNENIEKINKEEYSYIYSLNGMLFFTE